MKTTRKLVPEVVDGDVMVRPDLSALWISVGKSWRLAASAHHDNDVVVVRADTAAEIPVLELAGWAAAICELKKQTPEVEKTRDEYVLFFREECRRNRRLNGAAKQPHPLFPKSDDSGRAEFIHATDSLNCTCPTAIPADEVKRPADLLRWLQPGRYMLTARDRTHIVARGPVVVPKTKGKAKK